MTVIAEKTVLFADLRGSTSLFETLGNAEATSVVTHCVTTLSQIVTTHGGTLVKTLGDGLMAVFDGSAEAGVAAAAMHEALDALVSKGQQRGASSGLRALRLQVTMARGEIVEMGGDWFGDAVNVAARLIDHAGDNETLVTAEVYEGLPGAVRARFRSLDKLALRGRAEPVSVMVSGGRKRSDTAPATLFSGVAQPVDEPNGIRLIWFHLRRDFTSERMPIVLGRNPQSTFRVDDSRVSRSHARIEAHGGALQLVDLSYNGTYVQFTDGEIVSLRRGSCTLHGSGLIGLGGSPADPSSASVRFEVLRLGGAAGKSPRQ